MAYRIVLRKEGNRLYKDVSDYLRRHLSTVFTSDLGLLAKALVGGNEVAEASQDVTGEDLSYAAEEFIDGCLAVWLRYSSRLEEMAYPLDYLDNVLKVNRMPLVSQHGLEIFFESLSTELCEAPASSVLDLAGRIIVADKRQIPGFICTVNRNSLRQFVDMIEQLCMKGNGVDESEGLIRLQDTLGRLYLSPSKSFYDREAQAIQGSLLSVVDCCTLARRRLAEEGLRCQTILPPTFEARAKEPVFNMFRSHLMTQWNQYVAEVAALLESSNLTNLALIYQVSKSLDGEFSLLRDGLRAWITGERAVQRLNKLENGSTCNDSQEQASDQGLEDLSRRAAGIIEQAFYSDTILRGEVFSLLGNSCENSATSTHVASN